MVLTNRESSILVRTIADAEVTERRLQNFLQLIRKGNESLYEAMSRYFTGRTSNIPKPEMHGREIKYSVGDYTLETKYVRSHIGDEFLLEGIVSYGRSNKWEVDVETTPKIQLYHPRLIARELHARVSKIQMANEKGELSGIKITPGQFETFITNQFAPYVHLAMHMKDAGIATPIDYPNVINSLQ